MKISVLGCGWLGFPLAQNLLREGYDVKGSTTTVKKLTLLKQAKIKAFHIDLPSSIKEKESSPFWNADVLFLNIPPGRGSENVEKDYPKLIESVIKRAEDSEISWILFASSTSVYSRLGGITYEGDSKKGAASGSSGEAVLKAEEIVNQSPIDSTIFRFGGLYGYGRHPVKYLSGKKNLKDPSKPINLVHQIDCINVVTGVLKQDVRNEIFNVVSDGHPPRDAFYQSAAEHFGLEKPEFGEPENKDYRIVSNEKLKRELGYNFTYPNPMDHTP